MVRSIKDLQKCDFQPIVTYIEEEREKKKTLSKEEKNKIKEERERMEAPYVHVILDSHLEKNGNFRVEPAGLFRGRGEHPKMGQARRPAPPRRGRPIRAASAPRWAGSPPRTGAGTVAVGQGKGAVGGW